TEGKNPGGGRGGGRGGGGGAPAGRGEGNTGIGGAGGRRGWGGLGGHVGGAFADAIEPQARSRRESGGLGGHVGAPQYQRCSSRGRLRRSRGPSVVRTRRSSSRRSVTSACTSSWRTASIAASLASIVRNEPRCISCLASRFIRLDVDSSDSIRLPFR